MKRLIVVREQTLSSVSCTIFFENHGFGGKEVCLHADNCCGQNKNNIMVQYLLWRTLTNIHSKILLSFLIVEHTKFSPDWCFGLLKQKYRKTDIGSLDSLGKCVNASADCNHTQFVGMSDGTLIVPIFDWSSYFAVHTSGDYLGSQIITTSTLTPLVQVLFMFRNVATLRKLEFHF